MTRRLALTIPFQTVPLDQHADFVRALPDWGYTDVWTSEAQDVDGFTPLALASQWAPALRLGCACFPVQTRGPGLFAMSAAALAEAAPGLLRRYPSPAGLCERVAQRLSLEPDRVLVTAGGDDALDRCCRLALSSGGELILPEPGFVMTRRYAELSGGDVVSIPWMTAAYPTRAVLDAITTRTRAIVVTSPNNPTGGIATAADLQRLSNAAPEALLNRLNNSLAEA